MKFYGKAEETAKQILAAFERNEVPAALAQVMLPACKNRPSSKWSVCNQFLMALAGTSDARGFRQWQEVNRHVIAGSHAFYILGPCLFKPREGDRPNAKDDDGNPMVLGGFKSIPVFRYEDTDGAPLSGTEETRAHLDALPLLDVAQAWGLKVHDSAGGNSLGFYSPGRQEIGLAVRNLSTWTHELTHAADDRLTKLKPGQQPDQEIVAELGGAVLLEILGHHEAADLGGAWSYIKHYAGDSESKALTLAFELLDRTSKAVALILETADQYTAAETEPEAVPA